MSHRMSSPCATKLASLQLQDNMRFIQPVPLFNNNHHHHQQHHNNNLSRGDSGAVNGNPPQTHHWDTGPPPPTFTPNNLNRSYHHQRPFRDGTDAVASSRHHHHNNLNVGESTSPDPVVCITSADAVSFSKHHQQLQAAGGNVNNGAGRNVEVVVVASDSENDDSRKAVVVVAANGNEDVSVRRRSEDNNGGNVNLQQVETTLLNIAVATGYDNLVTNELYQRHDFGADFEVGLHPLDDIDSPSFEDNCYMEDEDTSCSSPSTCPSSVVDTPEPLNCRGIINPNYPGFQHLAHTLSEHFFDEHQIVHSSEDSDLSEFETEHSDTPAQGPDTHSDTLTKIEAIIRGAFKSRDDEEPAQPAPHQQLSPSVHSRMEFDEGEMRPEPAEKDDPIGGGDEEEDNDDEEEEEEEMERSPYISYTMLESSGEPSLEMTNIEKLTAQFDLDCADATRQRTPDILKKCSDANMPTKMMMSKVLASPDPKPDILQNVQNGDGVEEVEDIVGNFEMEVEHELDRVVSGYRSVLGDCDEQMQRNVQQVQQTIECLQSNAEKMERSLKKMADAVLSDAFDVLNNAASASASRSTSIERISADHRHHHAHNALWNDELAIAAADHADDDPVYHEKPAASNVLQAVDTPTKNKYHRRSYDDRELPPVVSINREIPWYHNNSNSSRPAPNNNASSSATIADQSVNSNNNNQPNSVRPPPPPPPSTTTMSTTNKKTTHHTSVRGFRLGTPDYYGDDTGVADTPRRTYGGGSMRSAAAAVPPVPVVVFRRHPLQAAAAAAATSSGRTINNNKSETDSSDGYERTGVQRKVLSSEKRRRGVRNAERDTNNAANFDVYNIETLPKIDLEAIENHLKAAKEEERRKRNDRKEILRRLAMGPDYDAQHNRSDKPLRKPSLHSRLQGGMNLQICFMNETASDTESPSSDSESCPKLSKSQTFNNRAYSTQVPHPYRARPLSVNIGAKSPIAENVRPSSLQFDYEAGNANANSEADFFTKQARLQIEARMALAQAKDIAHMQMEMERQKQKDSPITEIIRNSLEKVGIACPPEKRRVSRQMLTDMNIAQLQVIVNDLHTQIERLNEKLVQYLMERDELHMSQDSMLVDIEDLTRYLGAKEQNQEKPASDKKAILMMSQSLNYAPTQQNRYAPRHLAK